MCGIVAAVSPATNIVPVPLEIIEVPSGSHLSEDDIVRFEHAYGQTG